MFKDHRRAYLWFAIIMIVLGLAFLVISLISAITNDRVNLHERERQLYFDREILPDHVFYPVLMVTDRLELEMADEMTQTLLRMDYAGKRLEAAKTLFVQGKGDLAFVTLGKAHQYLMKANRDLADDEKKRLVYSGLSKDLNQQFLHEYENVQQYLNDAQKALTMGYVEELQAFEMENEMKVEKDKNG